MVKNIAQVKYCMNYQKVIIMKRIKEMKDLDCHCSMDILVIHYKDLHTIMKFL